MKRIVSYLPLILILASCTVREPRMDCPGYLIIDRSPFRVAGYEDTYVFIEDCHGGMVESSSYKIEDDDYERPMPKGRSRLSVIAGRSRQARHNDTLRVDYGEQGDRLYAYSSDAFITDDDFRVVTFPVKQYCVVVINIVGKAVSEYPYDLYVNALYNGMNLYTLQPTAGAFRAKAEETFDGGRKVILPRQGGPGVSLEIVMKKDGKSMGRIDLDNTLKAQGYDWSAVWLDDLWVDVDVTSNDASVKVIPWKRNDGYIDLRI